MNTKYVEQEAEHSDEEEVMEEEDGSENDSIVVGDDVVEYETGAEEEEKAKPTEKEFKRVQKKLTKPFLPKPSQPLQATPSRPFHFRVNFTNGNNFHKFLLPVANVVSELRFHLTSTAEFTGLRLEAHDTHQVIANKSRYECGIDEGEGVTKETINSSTFCVTASTFMQTLNCAVLSDTVLTVTKYVDCPEEVIFECESNEKDVRTIYSCSLLAESNLESLDGIRISLGFHVNVLLRTLKSMSLNAKKCGAPNISFKLYQAKDLHDSQIVHSKLSIGFKGNVTSGSHDFYQSAKKVNVTDSSIEWLPLAGLSNSEREKLTMVEKSKNEYDNSKLRLFLNHMDVEWVLIHLSDDSTAKPLVLECLVGGKNTKHTIILAPREDD